MAKLIQRCAGELRSLAAGKGEDVLHVHEVVAWAKSHRSSAIHEYLTKCGAFDARRAMELVQKILVRRLMRKCTILFTDLPEEQGPTRMPVAFSLWQDRDAGGGYRSTESIRGSESLRQSLIDTALRELKSLRERHKKLKELVAVWRAIDEVSAG